MAREDRDITFTEILPLHVRGQIRVEVQSDGEFNVIVFRVWSYKAEVGEWVPTTNNIRLHEHQLADFVRLGLRAHQSIQSRKTGR